MTTNIDDAQRPLAWDLKTLSERLSIAQSTLWLKIKRGEIASVLIGGRRLVPDEVVRQLLNPANGSGERRIRRKPGLAPKGKRGRPRKQTNDIAARDNVGANDR
jgi:hypothetical protein